jgi:hypothetical protein
MAVPATALYCAAAGGYLSMLCRFMSCGFCLTVGLSYRLLLVQTEGYIPHLLPQVDLETAATSLFIAWCGYCAEEATLACENSIRWCAWDVHSDCLFELGIS